MAGGLTRQGGPSKQMCLLKLPMFLKQPITHLTLTTRQTICAINQSYFNMNQPNSCVLLSKGGLARKVMYTVVQFLICEYQCDQMCRFFGQLGYFLKLLWIFSKVEVAQSNSNTLGYFLLKTFVQFCLNWQCVKGILTLESGLMQMFQTFKLSVGVYIMAFFWLGNCLGYFLKILGNFFFNHPDFDEKILGVGLFSIFFSELLESKFMLKLDVFSLKS